MIQTINIKTTTNNAFYDKGVVSVVPVAESLSTESKKDERNIAKYLVVPNICILSLSLSLSSRAGVNNTFFLLAYARAKRAANPVNKGLLGVSFVLFLCPYLNRNIEKLSTK